MLRITPHRQLELSQAAAQQRLANANALQVQISSGQRIHRPSDDPEGMRAVLSQRALIERLDVQLDSIDQSRIYLNQSNVELLEANRLVVQAKSLALQARGATEQSERVILANELDGFLETLQQVANSELNGRHLFAGTAIDQPPFTGIADGTPVYHGSRESGKISLPNESEIRVFLRGDRVFRFADAQGVSQDLFETIHTLSESLRADTGLSPSQRDEQIAQSIDLLDRASDHLLEHVGRQSVSLQQLDRIQIRTEDLKLEAQRLHSELNSPDFATAITQLQEEQNLLQYSFATITRIFDLSILDFLG